MRRLLSYGLLASAIALGGVGHSASAEPFGPCNGQVDASCYYYDSQGFRHTCTVYAAGRCVEPTVGHTLGGDCDGLVDVNCVDWSGPCTLWVWTLGCIVG